MGLNIDNLQRNRINVLKAETGALLFNLGKTHIGIKNWRLYFPNIDVGDFKKRYGYGFINVYRKYYSDRTTGKTPFEIDIDKINSILRELFESPIYNISPEITTMKQVIYGDSNNPGEFMKKVFFRGCENVNSGIDKGSPREKLNSLWIANAFGSYKEKVSEDCFDRERLRFLKRLADRLLQFNKNIRDLNPNEWAQVRNFIFTEIKFWYSHLLSDSRFPANDVTMWDQAYMTATLFKATIAALMLGGNKLKQYQKNPQSIRWRILGIQYDKLGLAEKGLKPVYVNWYRKNSKCVDNKIKKVVGIEYALGNEIFRDETGIYFLVPENMIEDRDNDSNTSIFRLHGDLKVVRERMLEVFTGKFGGEVYPAIFLTEASRGTMNIAYLIEKAKENSLKAICPKGFENKLKHDNNANGICQVCRVRLARRKEGEDGALVCKVCGDRKTSRINDWLNNISGETIWTGDLQDENGRIALITLKFELKEWLNGNLLSSTLIQRGKWQDLLDKMKLDIKCNGNCVLKKMIDRAISKIKSQTYVESVLLERSTGDEWEKFIIRKLGNKISFSERKIKWSQLNDADIEFLSRLLLQFLLRKNPSPARCRRIWETTENFLLGIENNIKNCMEVDNWRCKRLIWSDYVKDNSKRDKEYEYAGLNFWVDGKGNVYLISSITVAKDVLSSSQQKFYQKEIEELINKKRNNWLKDGEICLREYGKPDGQNFKLNLKSAKNEDFTPCFTILDPTPISCQFIVPTDVAPKLIKNIQDAYNKEFKWVIGKLPLHIGVIIQSYKKPLYIGIKALRSIRRDIENWNKIRQSIDMISLRQMQEKAFLCHSLEENVDKLENFYSLYEKERGEGSYEFYLKPENNPVWVGATREADKDDRFAIYPNTVDFEFMDVNTRRNDIYYHTCRAQRIKQEKRNRPYPWQTWNTFYDFKEYFEDKKLTNRLQNMVNLIYSKLSDWKNNDESTKIFLLSAFINVFDLKEENKNNEKQNLDEFAQLLGQPDWENLKTLPPDEFKAVLWQFIDMYLFWHTYLKRLTE